MSVKKLNIQIPKLDYQIINVAFKEGGQNVPLGENDLLFMSVKTYATSEDYLFQKSLDNGITYNSETKKYEIEITKEDTEKLKYNVNYGYDITIYYNGDKQKQKVVGLFTISEKYSEKEVV